MKHWVDGDGLRIAYRDAGSGPPLVLLHGWAMSSAVFVEAARELAGDFRILAPDLPGHGCSGAGVDYRLDALAGVLLSWMDALDLRDVRLLGWSLGGQLALRLATLAEERLSRLLLVATTPRFVAGEQWPHGQPDGQVAIMARSLKRRFEETLANFFAQLFAEGELSAARCRLVRRQCGPEVHPPRKEAALAALETLRDSDLRLQLPSLATPTLVMHGTGDAVIPHAAGRCLAEQLGATRFESLAGLGHAPFLSRPQDCFTLWREFCGP